MEWANLALLGLLLAGCWAAGYWAGGRAKPVALAAAALSCGFIAVRVVFRFRPDFEYPLLASCLYSAIQPWWVFLFVFISLGVGARRMSTWPLRAAVGICAVLLFAFALQRPWASATFEPGDFSGAPDQDGVCMQTQEYTCGAAAAATLLTRMGIPSDEREMARLCNCTPLTGTDEIAVCRALRARLQDSGCSVALERPTPDALGRELRPVMARMKGDLMCDHWVVLLAINDHVAVLGDPLLGKMTVSADEFFRDWRGTVVAINRPSPAFYATR